jgi:putative ABC transport system permease protein
MKRKGLLPRLALSAIQKNSSTYLPYIGISVFAMFTFFAFDLIIKNDVMSTLPRAAYATALMSIGFILLAIIIVPFLFYTNSFLIKRRKKELGLYSILGLEKRHIGIMMMIETLLIYGIVVLCSIVFGLLFSKVIFLLLLNLAKLPVNATFSISGKAVRDTMIFYAVISVINLIANLIQVGKANPVELMSEAKKGEKEPKHILIWTVLGIMMLGSGYYIAITSQIDSDIFLDFFLAVFLVVMGTHFLFTSGSIAILKGLRKKKSFYYRTDNFFAVSGMIYRMKKNAASLVNICIFATMVIITLVCTVSLYLGIPAIQRFSYPNDIGAEFIAESFIDRGSWEEELKELAHEDGVIVENYQGYESISVSILKQGNHILMNQGSIYAKDCYRMCFMTLEAFQGMEPSSYELGEGEVLVYSTGPDYGDQEIVFLNGTYQVKEELKSCTLGPKADSNTFNGMYYVIVPNYETLIQIASLYKAQLPESLIYTVKLNLQGEKEAKQLFSKHLEQYAAEQSGFLRYEDYTEKMRDKEAMYGGLLFIGIFFGLIFMLCLLIIMYYKQITEGFEDQRNFEILQKVGMSDSEVKSIIKKQVLQVFFIPLVGAIIHTIAGMFMVVKLMATLDFYHVGLIVICAVAVCAIFGLVYGISYNWTARTYYRIVKRMA